MNCSALYGRASLADLADDLSFLSANGLNPEVYLPAHLLDGPDRDWAEPLLRWREDGGELTFHAPFVDLSPGGLDPMVLEVTRHRFDQVLTLAERAGPVQIVFHPGFDKWRFAFHEDLWIENSVRFWDGVMTTASRVGTRVVLENVFDPRPDHLLSLRERVGKELGLCFDVGHFLLFSEVPLEAWLEGYGDGLAELHLHDNDGREDGHLPVGEGIFDFSLLCTRVLGSGLAPLVVLEHHSRKETRRSLESFAALMEEVTRDAGPGP